MPLGICSINTTPNAASARMANRISPKYGRASETRFRASPARPRFGVQPGVDAHGTLPLSVSAAPDSTLTSVSAGRL